MISVQSTEFKSFEEMTPEELKRERSQQWSIVKSDTTWWIHRNEIPFMRVFSKQEAEALLERFQCPLAFVDESQRPLTAEDFHDFRSSLPKVMGIEK